MQNNSFLMKFEMSVSGENSFLERQTWPRRDPLREPARMRSLMVLNSLPGSRVSFVFFIIFIQVCNFAIIQAYVSLFLNSLLFINSFLQLHENVFELYMTLIFQNSIRYPRIVPFRKYF